MNCVKYIYEKKSRKWWQNSSFSPEICIVRTESIIAKAPQHADQPRTCRPSASVPRADWTRLLGTPGPGSQAQELGGAGSHLQTRWASPISSSSCPYLLRQLQFLILSVSLQPSPAYYFEDTGHLPHARDRHWPKVALLLGDAGPVVSEERGPRKAS